MFGCTWKINFPENIFSWSCVLVGLTRKLVLVQIFTSNHFWTHTQRERERERERESLRLRLCRSTNPPITPSTSPITPSTSSIYKLIYEPTNRSSTQSLRPTSLRLRRRPRAFAPWTDLSLCVILIFCVILIDPRTDLHFCVIFDFLLFLFDLWFFFVVVVVVWVVVFWWFSYCVVVENSIFRMLPNIWKYFLEQFS